MKHSCDKTSSSASGGMKRLLFLACAFAGCGGNNNEAPSPDAAMGSGDPGSSPQIVPSNGGDLVATGLSVTTPDGMRFDTDASCASPSLLGNCTIATQSGGPDLCLCHADHFTIGDATVRGSRALVLLAWKDVAINGTLDLGGDGAAPGAGSIAQYQTISSTLSAAGGSFGTRGANGAPVRGTDELVPLVAGMAGQDSCGGHGGGGGGALQITAGVKIEIAGAIDAGGGGGSGGSSSCVSAAGGGSGGAILLEAPSVIVRGMVAANGGGGGGGGAYGRSSGGIGHNGVGIDRALGGQGADGHGCSLYGYTSGGDGGYGATGAVAASIGQGSSQITGCLGGTELTGQGGSGGGVGRIRINTQTGCQCGGQMSPVASIGNLTIQ